MKRQVMLDRGTRLDRLDLEGSAYVGEHGRTERKGLGMMLLPALVLSSQIKGARVLQVGGEDNGLVTSFTWQLDTKVPGIESDEDEVEVLRGQMLRGEGIEAIDGVSKGTGVSHMFPGQGC
jgi:hypothetical protein